MKSLFSHLTLAHHYWQLLVQPGDTVIDATCGNGKDTLFLAKLCLTPNDGCLIGLDLQQDAINNTRALLEKELPKELLRHVHLCCQSHAEFPYLANSSKLKLIVYNLGYLPGGNKEKTTLTASTLKSLERAMELLAPGGYISLTCYPGHPEGERELSAILLYLTALPSPQWAVTHHIWANRPASPQLFFVNKKF